MTTADDLRAAAARANDATYDDHTTYETAGLPDPAAAAHVSDEARFPCGCRYHRTATDLTMNRISVDACPEHVGLLGGVATMATRRHSVTGSPAMGWSPAELMVPPRRRRTPLEHPTPRLGPTRLADAAIGGRRAH